ncbi:MAG TPA: XdhC family protein [Anaerolineae bacterium]|nr:XdhC family protein [Anaerolineae bacterium]
MIFGAGHVGRATAHLAKWLGFRVIVADDRSDLASADWIPEADQYVTGSINEQLDQININSQTYILSLTRGVMIDIETLPALLNTDATYIGVIGSRRRWQTALKQLREQGVSEEKLNRVHAPIGLELNAETPEEIATSIMAEVVMLKNKGSGKSMMTSDT